MTDLPPHAELTLIVIGLTVIGFVLAIVLIRLTEQECQDKGTQSALQAARNHIQQERDALYQCELNPQTGMIDYPGAMEGLNELDALLEQCDEALGKARKESTQ